MFSVGQRVIATPMARLHFPQLLFGLQYVVCLVVLPKNTRSDATYVIADLGGNNVVCGVPECELRPAFDPPKRNEHE